MKPREIRFPRVIFGPGASALLGKEAAKYGRKALLVTGRTFLRESGILAKILEDLEQHGVEVVHYPGTEPNPKVDFIDRGGELARGKGCDMVIGVGGGSVMDAAKGIALIAAQGGNIWDYVYYGPGKSKKPEKALKIILMPTTAATSSEVNDSLVVSNPELKQKMPVFGPPLYPVVSLVDPELTFTLSPELTAEGAVDTLCHVLEPYLTSHEDFLLSDKITISIIETVIKYAPIAQKKEADLYVRSQLSLAAHLALSPFPRIGRNGGLRLHWIEHVLSGYYDHISHGKGLSLLLIPWLRHNIQNFQRRFEQLAEALFGQADVELLIEKMEEWLVLLGFSGKLRDYGVKERDLQQMAEDVEKLYSWGGGNKDEALYVLTAAY